MIDRVSPLFDRWLYVVTGFLQTAGTRTRLVEFWSEAHAAYCDRETAVLLRTWNAPWAAEAELAFRLSDGWPEITGVFYSWAGGWGMRQFARQLQRRGLQLDNAILIDPVYRHPYPWGQWRTLLPWWPITIPGNVRNVWAWRQSMNWPKGHALRCESKQTAIHCYEQVAATHENMDDSPYVLAQVRSLVTRIFDRQ